MITNDFIYVYLFFYEQFFRLSFLSVWTRPKIQLLRKLLYQTLNHHQGHEWGGTASQPPDPHWLLLFSLLVEESKGAWSPRWLFFLNWWGKLCLHSSSFSYIWPESGWLGGILRLYTATCKMFLMEWTLD